MQQFYLARVPLVAAVLERWIFQAQPVSRSIRNPCLKLPRPDREEPHRFYKSSTSRYSTARPISGNNRRLKFVNAMSVASHQIVRARYTERRLDRRYPISIELAFKVRRGGRVVQSGTGRTLDVSSRGVLFESESELPPAGRIDLTLAWPVLLNEEVGLNLCVTGHPVRVEGNRAAITFTRYVFRVRPRRDAPARPAASPSPEPPPSQAITVHR